MTDKQEMDIKSIGAELAKILIDMTDEEKGCCFRNDERNGRGQANSRTAEISINIKKVIRKCQVLDVDPRQFFKQSA